MARKAPIAILIGAAVQFAVFSGTVSAGVSTIAVDYRNPTVCIRAENVPFSEAIDMFSKKTGVVFDTPNLPKDPFSCDLEGVTFEKAVKSLFKGCNYLIRYKKSENGEYVPASVTVIGRFARSDSEQQGLTVLPPGGRVLNKDYLASVADDEEQFAGVTATLTSEGSQNGIQLTQIYEAPFLTELGLVEGDTILDVNGLKVNSVAEFVQSLKKISATSSSVTIGVTRGDSAESLNIRFKN